MTEAYTFEEILRYGLALVLVGSILIAIAFSLWGGLLLITSGGKEEKVKPAVNHIRHAIIGLVVLMIILFSAPVLARIFGLDYGEFLRPSSIFSTIKEITANIFGTASPSDFDTGIDSSSIGDDFTDL